MCGLIRGSMKEIGCLIRCKEEELLHGVMGECMKENIMMTRNRDMVYSLGQIIENTQEDGMMGSNMDLVNISPLKES